MRFFLLASALALWPPVLLPSTDALFGLAGEAPTPELHEGQGWAVFSPQGWRKTEIAGLELYLRGDGIAPMPRLDGAFSPLMLGMVVERKFPKGFKLDQLEKWLKGRSGEG